MHLTFGVQALASPNHVSADKIFQVYKNNTESVLGTDVQYYPLERFGAFATSRNTANVFVHTKLSIHIGNILMTTSNISVTIYMPL